MFVIKVLVFPGNYYMWWALLSWKWLIIHLLMSSSEWIFCIALFVCAVFALPIKTSLSQPTSSHTFISPILSPILLWESERVAEWWWATYYCWTMTIIKCKTCIAFLFEIHPWRYIILQVFSNVHEVVFTFLILCKGAWNMLSSQI